MMLTAKIEEHLSNIWFEMSKIPKAISE